jgi:hypothetical protein
MPLAFDVASVNKSKLLRHVRESGPTLPTTARQSQEVIGDGARAGSTLFANKFGDLAAQRRVLHREPKSAFD